MKKWLGLDFLDLLIQAAVTFSLMGFVGVSDGPEELFPVIAGASFVVLGVRRHFALRRRAIEGSGEVPAERLIDMEDRLGELDQLRDRVLELEERLDFTERLLTRQQESGKLPK